jgi:hypothetical protein
MCLLQKRCQEWYNTTPNAECHFSLKCAEQQLMFDVSVINNPPNLALCDNEGEGAFIEGLWTGDCGELFLSNPSTGFYVELHLSPLGSWWCCSFSSPLCRVTDRPERFAGVTTSSSRQLDGWTASLSLPLSSLPLELQFDSQVSTGNVTFCLHSDAAPSPLGLLEPGDTDPSPRQRDQEEELFFSYFTLRDDTHRTPNFHLPHKWNRILSAEEERTATGI